MYQSSCDQKHQHIEIRDFHVTIIDHNLYDEDTTIMDIEIHDGFSLVMQNNTISIPHMDKPKVSVLFLKFPTLNTKVYMGF